METKKHQLKTTTSNLDSSSPTHSTQTTTAGTSSPSCYFIQTPWKKNQRKFKKFLGKSHTVPGQSQSIQKIMDAFKIGMPTQGYTPIYSENTDLDLGINPLSLDYVDIQDLTNENIRRINELQSKRNENFERMQQELKNKQILAFEEKLREKIAAEMAEKH